MQTTKAGSTLAALIARAQSLKKHANKLNARNSKQGRAVLAVLKALIAELKTRKKASKQLAASLHRIDQQCFQFFQMREAKLRARAQKQQEAEKQQKEAYYEQIAEFAKDELRNKIVILAHRKKDGTVAIRLASNHPKAFATPTGGGYPKKKKTLITYCMLDGSRPTAGGKTDRWRNCNSDTLICIQAANFDNLLTADETYELNDGRHPNNNKYIAALAAEIAEQEILINRIAKRADAAKYEQLINELIADFIADKTSTNESIKTPKILCAQC